MADDHHDEQLRRLLSETFRDLITSRIEKPDIVGLVLADFELLYVYDIGNNDISLVRQVAINGKRVCLLVPGPNPRLEEFIKAHATPYDPAKDKCDVPAFDRDLIVDKAAPPKAIYDMHSYWSKKHWAAIREYIRHYLPEKYYPRGTGLVLDCFSGSGMTGALRR